MEEGKEANQLNNQDHNNRVHIHMLGWQDQFCMFLFLNIHSIHMLLKWKKVSYELFRGNAKHTKLTVTVGSESVSWSTNTLRNSSTQLTAAMTITFWISCIRTNI